MIRGVGSNAVLRIDVLHDLNVHRMRDEMVEHVLDVEAHLGIDAVRIERSGQSFTI